MDRSTHEVFEVKAAATPHAVALVFEDQRLSFAELNLRANRLAHYLQTFGVGPDVLVGIHLHRSLEAGVALLAVLKAGGAFVVLDPAHPNDRLERVVNHAQLRVIVTDSRTATALPSRMAAAVVDLAQVSAAIAAQSPANRESGVKSDHIAYVAYTSGSTGEPKGVVVRHRGLVAQLSFMPFQSHDTCALNMSLDFAWAVHRLIVPLMFGAAVVILPDETVKDPAEFSCALETHGITNIALVPSALRQLLDVPKMRSRLHRLQTVTVGGTTVPPDLIESFLRLMPQARLFQLYGSSEALAIAMSQRTVSEITKDRSPDMVSAVRPVDSAAVYVLDPEMRPAPAGTPGELYVGGPQLARGYLHEPSLTAERFVPNPFDGGAGERLYRTGDLGRYLPNGEIELLGRADRQVKIRGFRVELDAVEAALRQHPAIQEAAVVAREMDREMRLVAYVVSRTGTTVETSEWHNFVRQRLPEAMRPSAFVPLEHLPLNSNGKLDVSVLPLPGAGRPELSSPYEAPRNSAEAAIAQIWAGQLGVDLVGVHDHFLELGGDSLIAARILSRIGDLMNVKVPFGAIFDGTVASLAEHVAHESRYGATNE